MRRTRTHAGSTVSCSSCGTSSGRGSIAGTAVSSTSEDPKSAQLTTLSSTGWESCGGSAAADAAATSATWALAAVSAAAWALAVSPAKRTRRGCCCAILSAAADVRHSARSRSGSSSHCCRSFSDGLEAEVEDEVEDEVEYEVEDEVEDDVEDEVED